MKYKSFVKNINDIYSYFKKKYGIAELGYFEKVIINISIYETVIKARGIKIVANHKNGTVDHYIKTKK